MSLTRSQKIGSVNLGTSQYPWLRPSTSLSSFNGTLNALGLYTHLVTLPANDAANGVFLLGPFDPTSSVSLRFHGTHGTDADGKVGYARIWFLDELIAPTLADNPVEYCGFPQLDLTLTIGNTSLNTSSKIVTGVSGNLHKAVDTITVTADYTRNGAVVIGATGGTGNDAWPCITWDRIGSPFVVVQLELDTATGLGVMYKEL